MPLANIYYPSGGGPNAWEIFWFNNFIDHQEIQQAVQAQKMVDNPIYPIIPWVQDNVNNLLELHQSFHDDMNAALGLNGQDLSQLDFKNQKAVNDWCFTHYLEHQGAHVALGI